MKIFLFLLFLFFFQSTGIFSQSLDSLRSHLVAEWMFNGNLDDSSGKENHAEGGFNITPTEDRFGKPDSAYEMDGDGHILVLNITS
jgi:hypothetical protein